MSAKPALLSWAMARVAIFRWGLLALVALVGSAAIGDMFVGLVWALFLAPIVPVAVFERWAEDRPPRAAPICAVGAAVIGGFGAVLVLGQLIYVSESLSGRALDGALMQSAGSVIHPLVWWTAAIFSVPVGAATYLRLRAAFHQDRATGRTTFVVFVLGLVGAVVTKDELGTIIMTSCGFVAFVAVGALILLGFYALADRLDARWDPDA